MYPKDSMNVLDGGKWVDFESWRDRQKRREELRERVVVALALISILAYFVLRVS